MIYMLWNECVCLLIFVSTFVRNRTFYILTRKNVLYPKVSEIVWKFIQNDEKNYNKLRNNLCQFKNIFQYVYSNIYLEVYCSTERRGFDLKSTLQLAFKAYKNKKKLNKQEKILKIIKQSHMILLYVSKNQKKLTCLTTKRKKK